MSRNAKQRPLGNDDDIRPEYDFSRGLRGVHAYRFSKLSSDEALILGYWQGKGFEVAAFSTREMRDLKTPDFRLSRDGVEVALCEVKSFQRDEWLEDQLRNSQSGELIGGLRPDPIFNRITNAVHTAFKQFESVNPEHKLFNFLVLVNHDTSARPEDLDRVLTGYEDPLNGCFERTCTQFSEGRIREEKNRIDLFLWMDFKKPDEICLRRFFFGNLQTRKPVCKLIGVDPSRIKDIPPAA